MRDPSDDDSLPSGLEQMKAETKRHRVEFLKTELSACFTFARVAEAEQRTGNRESAERALAAAEKGYSTLLRFASDVNPAADIGDEARREFTPEIERLRAWLDDLNRSLK